MTDEEFICGWMEPKPLDTECGERGLSVSEGGWWERSWDAMNQRFRHWPNSNKMDSLDAIHEIETRLTDEQWKLYTTRWPISEWPGSVSVRKALLHATAEQKIAALADTLDPARKVRGAK